MITTIIMTVTITATTIVTLIALMTFVNIAEYVIEQLKNNPIEFIEQVVFPSIVICFTGSFALLLAAI